MGSIKWMGRIIYKNLAAWDDGLEGLLIIRQSISISSGIYRSDNGSRKDGAYDEF